MLKLFERETFEHFRDRDSGRVFSGFEFRKCQFSNCLISATLEPRLRSIIRDVKILQCEAVGCAIDTAVLENVLIDGLKTNGCLIVWGAVFKHVVLKGKIGRLLLSRTVGNPVDPDPLAQRAFDEASEEYYANVDWALDISEGMFEDLDIRSVPGHLIRRDPATQFLVTREKAMQGTWRELDLSKTHWPTALELFLESGAPADVLVARKGHRKFKSDLDGLMKLRDAGVAEPD